jgi:hypothetical protein
MAIVRYEYLIKVELPEIWREDVEVIVQDSTLMISNQPAIEKEEKGGKYHRVERAYGHWFAESTRFRWRRPAVLALERGGTGRGAIDQGGHAQQADSRRSGDC